MKSKQKVALNSFKDILNSSPSNEADSLIIKRLIKMDIEEIEKEKKDILDHSMFFPCFFSAEELQGDIDPNSIHSFFRLGKYSLISIKNNGQKSSGFPTFNSPSDFIESYLFNGICQKFLSEIINNSIDELKTSGITFGDSLDSELVVSATYSKFGVRFSTEGEANPSVRSKEDFFMYSIRHIFSYSRTPKATTTWLSLFFKDLNQVEILERMKREDNTTQAIFISLMEMFNLRDRFKEITPVVLKERLVPFMELHGQGNPFFNKYNISIPLLSPNASKYIRESFLNSTI
jgi:hypothetical protein